MNEGKQCFDEALLSKLNSSSRNLNAAVRKDKLSTKRNENANENFFILNNRKNCKKTAKVQR